MLSKPIMESFMMDTSHLSLIVATNRGKVLQMFAAKVWYSLRNVYIITREMQCVSSSVDCLLQVWLYLIIIEQYISMCLNPSLVF